MSTLLSHYPSGDALERDHWVATERFPEQLPIFDVVRLYANDSERQAALLLRILDADCSLTNTRIEPVGAIATVYELCGCLRDAGQLYAGPPTVSRARFKEWLERQGLWPLPLWSNLWKWVNSEPTSDSIEKARFGAKGARVKQTKNTPELFAERDAYVRKGFNKSDAARHVVNNHPDLDLKMGSLRQCVKSKR